MDTLLAYFDPGSGSLLIQALAGGTAGLMLLARYFWDSYCFSRYRQRDGQHSVQWRPGDGPAIAPADLHGESARMLSIDGSPASR